MFFGEATFSSRGLPADEELLCADNILKIAHQNIHYSNKMHLQKRILNSFNAHISLPSAEYMKIYSNCEVYKACASETTPKQMSSAILSHGSGAEHHWCLMHGLGQDRGRSGVNILT